MSSPMNIHISSIKTLLSVSVVSFMLLACTSGMTRPEGADDARSKLTKLQSTPELASHAPVEIKDAEIAVRAAEQPQRDDDLAKHLVLMADRKVDIAWAQAQARLSEHQRKSLSEQRETARLDSRTREADSARMDANIARSEADQARIQAEAARGDAEVARQQAEDLRAKIADLNAKATDRGLVMTLGDVLFATGKSELKGSATGNLGKLAAFLNSYPDRTVIIEGHTDNVGSEDSNQGLSQRRADSVRSFLVSQGVSSPRLSAIGKGENSPVSGNDSATGRQQNRRVEVIISNTVSSAAR